MLGTKTEGLKGLKNNEIDVPLDIHEYFGVENWMDNTDMSRIRGWSSAKWTAHYMKRPPPEVCWANYTKALLQSFVSAEVWFWSWLCFPLHHSMLSNLSTHFFLISNSHVLICVDTDIKTFPNIFFILIARANL